MFEITPEEQRRLTQMSAGTMKAASTQSTGPATTSSVGSSLMGVAVMKAH
jgi:hypothetical protein